MLAILFILQQASYFLGMGATMGDRQIHSVQLISWLALSTTMLLLLATGRACFQRREVRRLVNDEGTRAHRNSALSTGYFASIGTCIIVHLVSISGWDTGRGAVHLIMSVGIATALVRFAFLERRAARNG